MWFRQLRVFLRSIGIKGSHATLSLFIRTNDHTIFLLVYVVTSLDENKVQGVIDQFGNEFAIWKLQNLSFFLRIRVKRSRKAARHLNQGHYQLNLLRSCVFDNMKPSRAPMTSNFNFLSNEDPIDNDKEIRKIVGSLQYLTLIRLNITFVVSKIAQFMAKPQSMAKHSL